MRAKLAAANGQLCLPCCLETPLAQKRGGAKHIREVVYTEPDRFSKVAPMRNLKRSGSRDSGRYQVYSLVEPRLLALIWPEAKARVVSSPKPSSERVELDGGPIVTRLQ